MKIFFIETTDMDRETSYGQMAYISEAEAEQVAKQKAEAHGGIGYSYMVQELDVLYAHRNGETEDTEVDGWYLVECLGIWTIRDNPCQSDDPDSPLERYYGPIPIPEL